MPKKRSALADRNRGLFLGFDGSRMALNEVQRFCTKAHRIIVLLTVNDVLDEEIVTKLV